MSSNLNNIFWSNSSTDNLDDFDGGGGGGGIETLFFSSVTASFDVLLTGVIWTLLVTGVAPGTFSFGTFSFDDETVLRLIFQNAIVL